MRWRAFCEAGRRPSSSGAEPRSRASQDSNLYACCTGSDYRASSKRQENLTYPVLGAISAPRDEKRRIQIHTASRDRIWIRGGAGTRVEIRRAGKTLSEETLLQKTPFHREPRSEERVCQERLSRTPRSRKTGSETHRGLGQRVLQTTFLGNRALGDRVRGHRALGHRLLNRRFPYRRFVLGDSFLENGRYSDHWELDCLQLNSTE